MKEAGLCMVEWKPFHSTHEPNARPGGGSQGCPKGTAEGGLALTSSDRSRTRLIEGDFVGESVQKVWTGTRTILHEALDPNKGRLDLLQAVEKGVHPYV